MKKMPILRILSILFLATIFFSACTKETSDVRLTPQISTSQYLNVTSDAATVVGFIVAAGDGFTEKGVCYNTDTIPTIANSKVAYSGDQTTATFTVVLSGLDYVTKYYVRAYGTSAAGTIYGEEFTFTTLPVLPTITTTEISAISFTTATTGGNVTADGRANVTARGVCYSLVSPPTIADSKTSDSLGMGEFASELTGLVDNKTYYVRAYATNSAGTAYGEVLEFTTLEILITSRTWYIPGDYVAASYPGFTFLDWDPANSPMIKSLEAAPDLLEGYVYMANAANQWKFASQPNWDGPNYGDDDNSGVLNPSAANNINSPAGYYKINADAAALTYTAIATVWGVIGDATPGGWDSETPLVYEPESRTWRGGLHLTAASIKFRANQDWAYNYGSTAVNDTLDAGGANIPVAIEDDYFFVLDLSHPNAYTYTANRWGLIGSATPGGWDSDQNMTWDAVNQSLTITVDLVVGEIKFRANDEWAINLGGDVNALEPGGANISVAEAGNYTIHLFLSNVPTCTIVKN